MSFFKKLPFVTKLILSSVIMMLLISTVLIITNVFVQREVLTTQIEEEASRVVESWGEELNLSTVESAVGLMSYESQPQQELTAFFDSISMSNPNVAQGYIFSTDLNEEGQSAIIGTPTHITEELVAGGVSVGDLWEHPLDIRESIQRLNQSGEVAVSEIYEDPFGTWITALYPLTNNEGDIFAFFAVDVDASSVGEGTALFITSSLIILIPAIIIAIIIQVIWMRNRSKPLKELMTGLNELREGNLNISLPTREDDLGLMNQAFNKMASELKGMLGKIAETSTVLLHSSTTVAEGATQLNEDSTFVNENVVTMASGVKQQEISMMETASAVEQIASEIGSIASATYEVTKTSKELTSSANEGVKSIEEVSEQMRMIHHSVDHSRKIVEELKIRSDEITNILDVITKISEQTNLLALNAAIEAARAGEGGKGFAVVAQEVRKLAEESRHSTMKIGDILKEIQQETNSAFVSMEKGTKEVNKGKEIANATQSIFESMNKYSEQMAIQIESVAAASQEISAGTQEASASINDLTTIAQHHSARTSEIEKSTMNQLHVTEGLTSESKELNKLAKDLQSMTTGLKV
ncbi:methyl-accepting chemotaxis protein [Alteribacter aurantiacus]|uniref:methyl-accepting chemotaxis protein n=1 Tax=Alteribacter aurantiacus TaxID=254410 RepID=UPI0004166F2E|nr:HAMP domain-containing methyl-accepting chemotaxis protein [Alteribacter aurantiacus]